ncbi:MAG: RNA-binding protein hfq [Cyanophyceae cyanobacterium]
MAEFQTGLPSSRQVQIAIREKKDVEVKLLTDDLILGKVSWQDQDCICIIDQYDQPTIVWRHAIAFIKPKS